MVAEQRFRRMLKNQKYLLFMIVPIIIWFIIFNYVPIYGWIMAFVNYVPGKPLLSSKFVGLEHFEYFIFKSNDFVNVMVNSIGLNFLNIFFSQLFAIIFAVMLNEIRAKHFKRFVQSVSFIPYLVSWAIVANVFYILLSLDNGMLNDLLMFLGMIKEPIYFMAEPKYSWTIFTIANVWKSFGYNAVIYLAAISGIDGALYDAAIVDGAGRFGVIRHVVLPGMVSTIAVLLLISIGAILNTGFDQYYLLSNPITFSKVDVIDTYTVRNGMERGLLSYSTAIGVFKSVVSLILVGLANTFMKHTTGNSLY